MARRNEMAKDERSTKVAHSYFSLFGSPICELRAERETMRKKGHYSDFQFRNSVQKIEHWCDSMPLFAYQRPTIPAAVLSTTRLIHKFLHGKFFVFWNVPQHFECFDTNALRKPLIRCLHRFLARVCFQSHWLQKLTKDEIVSASDNHQRQSLVCLSVCFGFGFGFRPKKKKLYKTKTEFTIFTISFCLFADISFVGVASRRQTDHWFTRKCNHTAWTVSEKNYISVEHAQFKQFRCERIDGTGKIWICK